MQWEFDRPEQIWFGRHASEQGLDKNFATQEKNLAKSDPKHLPILQRKLRGRLT
jgi:hypothetical protein